MPVARRHTNCSALVMEHRWGTRSATSQRGYVHAPNGVVTPMQIVNVSLSGCLLETHLHPPLFATVQLDVPTLRDHPMLHGQIVRHTDRGFAIEWASFPDARVLASLTRAPPLLVRANRKVRTSRASPRR